MFHGILILVALSAGTNFAQALDPPSLRRIVDGRVVGGEATTIEQFPYQVSLRHFGTHRCGAAIVKPNFIISAAHCLQGLSALFLRFVAGSSFRNTGGESLYVEKVIIHAGYDPRDAANDIALVKMDGFFEYSSFIQPIELARKSDFFRAGTKAAISGWGTESEGANELPFQLRYTHVYGISPEACTQAYADRYPILPGMICAAYPGGGKDSCQGDSGGPLAVARKLVGIVSWGLGCARNGYPGVYTDVAYYREWIDEELKK